MTAPAASRPSPGRRALSLVAGNRISQVYLLIVLALLVWVAVDTTLVHQEDASFASVVPMLATLPWGFAVALLPDGSTAGFFAVVVAGALINAALIGLVAGRRRG
ncbi:hypothetical protein RM572_09605 [Streptomyces sp. DSM 42041]|uniref:Uncharacterized protein n=1 Tax=Streptomyces hazeniae TaxID=3075538 RepID=A0ABU2NPW6_9ACTN|nr:hypothetical protein [Streptomyces sp. DSM 42041]MDT0379025.1 hypothetical protein [Streptomyces sp. DSM 42041]